MGDDLTNKRQKAIRNPWADTDPSVQPRVHRRFRAVLAGMTLTVAIVLVAITIATQVTYGTLVWWTHPATLHWCGRTYRRDRVDVVRRSEITLGSLPGTAAFPLKTIGRLPPLVGWQVIASVTPRAIRDRPSPPIPCAMSVYVESWGGRYAEYLIEGGP